MKKKLNSLLLIILTGMVLVACKNEPKVAASEELKEDVAGLETTDEMADTTADTTITDQPEVTEESEMETEETEADKIPDAYIKILDTTYELLTTDTSDRTWQDGEIGIAEVINGNDTQANLAGVGYCFLDLDENGTDELIICENAGDEPSRILALYTFSDQEPVLLVEGWFRNRYYILKDNRIYNEGSGGAAYTIFGTYHINQDGNALELESYIFSDYEDMNDMSSLSWFQSTQVPAQVGNSEKMKFEDENEPYNMMDSFLEDCKKLDLLLFSDYK